MMERSILLIFTLIMKIQGTSIIEQCLQDISKKYFTTRTLQMFSWTRHDYEEYRRTLFPAIDEIDILSYFLQENWTMILVDQEYEEPSLEYLHFKNDIGKIKHTVIDLTRIYIYEIYNYLEKVLSNPYWNSRANVLVIFNNCEEIYIKFILNSIWTSKRAENVTVMIIKSKNDVVFYSWYPYVEKQCREVNKVEIFGVYNNKTFRDSLNIFPKKITNNMHKCKFMVSTLYIPPLSFGNNADEDGLETIIIRTIIDFYNLTMDYFDIPKDDFIFYSSTPDGKLIGGFAVLHQQEADVIYGGMFLNRKRYHISRPLISHYEDSYVWVVPVPSKPSSWKSIYQMFTPLLWMYIFVTFFFISAVVCFIAKFEITPYHNTSFISFISSLLIIWQQFLNGSISSTPKSTLLKLFLFVVSIYILHIKSTYESSLITGLTKPLLGKPFENIHEVVDSGLVFNIVGGMNSMLNQSDYDLWKKIYTPGKYEYSNEIYDIFEKVATEKSVYFLISKALTKYMIRTKYTDDFGNPRIHFLKNPYFYSHASYYMSPGNVLRKPFNKKIRQIIESGLPQFWLKNIIDKSDNGIRKRTVVLTCEHLEGAFMIPVVGLCLSLVVFLIELCFPKMKCLSRQETFKGIFVNRKDSYYHGSLYLGRSYVREKKRPSLEEAVKKPWIGLPRVNKDNVTI